MTKDGVARGRRSRDIFVGIQNIGSRRFRVVSVIHENDDILFVKSAHVDNVVLHVQAIIMTATQFTILSNVINPNQYSTASPCALRRHNVECLIDIHRLGRGQLRNLREFSSSQNPAHFAKNLDKGQL